MQRSDVLQQLRNYIAENVLQGKDVGLDETTPLLEWGILNSFEMVGLLGYIQQEFEINISNDQVIAENFADLLSITQMVLDSTPATSEK